VHSRILFADLGTANLAGWSPVADLVNVFGEQEFIECTKQKF